MKLEYWETHGARSFAACISCSQFRQVLHFDFQKNSLPQALAKCAAHQGSPCCLQVLARPVLKDR